MNIRTFALALPLTFMLVDPAIGQEKTPTDPGTGFPIGNIGDKPDFNFPEQGAEIPDSALAGIGASGAVATDSTTITKDETSSIELKDEAQRNVTAANVTNTSEGKTANATNVSLSTGGQGLLPGGEMGQGSGTPSLSANQSNGLEQKNTIVQTGEGNASLGEFETYETLATIDSSTSRSLTSDSSVDTKQEILGQTVQTGSGGAGSGDLNFELSGGQVSAKPKFVLEGKGEGSLLEAGPLKLGTVDVSAKQTLEVPVTVDVPDAKLGFTGSGCGVYGGSCTASGSDEQSTSTSTDLDSELTKRVADIQAEYVLLGGGSVNETSVSSVSLSDNAQRDVQALNVVNSSNSSVANGLNAAVSSNNTLSINDTNIVRQQNVMVQR